LTDLASHVDDDEVVAMCMRLYKNAESHGALWLIDQSFD